MDERRKCRRTPAKEKAVLESREHSRQESQLIDVSSGGIRIISDTNIKVGTIVSGKFKIMPTLGDFYISAEVAWNNPISSQASKPLYEVGIKFNKVSTIPVH